jgi:hypothetical protein
MQTILELGAARVFYDGILAEPRLDLPEGLAVHRDGSVWCGGERGQIYRIEADGSSIEQVSSSAGFSHEMAFDTEGNLYIACYEPSQVLRVAPDGTVVRLIRARRLTCFATPPTWLFRCNVLFTTNLGRWHISVIDIEVEGLPLHGGYGGNREAWLEEAGLCEPIGRL